MPLIYFGVIIRRFLRSVVPALQRVKDKNYLFSTLQGVFPCKNSTLKRPFFQNKNGLFGFNTSLTEKGNFYN